MITCVGLLSGVRLCHLGNHFQRHIYTSKSPTLSNIMLTALIWITDKIQRGEIPLDRADWAFLMFSAYGVFRLTGDRKESHHETIKCIADGNMKTQLHVFPILKCFLLSHFNVQGQLHDWISQHSGHDISQRKGMLWALYKLRSIDRICDNVHYHKRKRKEKNFFTLFS